VDISAQQPNSRKSIEQIPAALVAPAKPPGNQSLPIEPPPGLDNPVRLLRQLSHDLRSPMSAVIGTCGLLLEGSYEALSATQARAIQRILRNSERVNLLLDHLMIYVKAEVKDYPLDSSPFGPAQVLMEWLTPIREAAETKGLTLRHSTDGTAPQTVIGDAGAIKLILQAVLWNAVSFTQAGEIRVGSMWHEGRKWELRVSDTGQGIAPEERPYIFQPFWRGSADRTTVPTSGTGMGLAFAQALARLMNGTLSLVETSDKGSTFSLRIPFPAEQAATP
jgi:two-component system capsular synthesis sensor histidine kinase RcsC